MRAFLLLGLIGGALVGVDPFGWDEVGPFRWFIVSTCAFALVATSGGRIRRDLLALLWAALLGWLAVSALLGVDRFHAWVGTPDRHFGWLTWLLCGALFAVGRAMDTDDAQEGVIALAGRAVVVASLLGALIAVVEAAGWSLAEAEFAGGRLGGAFSQPALLGAASVLCVPIAVAVALDQRGSIVWRWTAAAATVAGVFTLIGSQTRGAWAATVVIGAVAAWTQRAAVRAVWQQGQRWQRVLFGLVVAGAGVAVALTVPVLSRVRSVWGSDGGLAGRIDEWQVAVRALTDRPLFGWGPEGYRIAFARHVDADYVVAHGRLVITDRAHSGPLDAAVVGGVPGGLLYVALLLVVGVGLWRVLHGGDGLRAGIALGVGGYFAQQLFLFPLAELDPVAWLLAGLTLGSVAQGGDSSINRNAVEVAPIVRGLAFGLAGVAALAGVLDVVGDHRVHSAVSSTDPQDAVDAADTARLLRGDSIRYDFIASRLAAANNPSPVAIQASLDRLDSALAFSPRDPAVRGEHARRLLDLALTTGAAGDATTALAGLEALVLDDPLHPEHLGRLGIARAIHGDDADAEAAFRLAIELDPDNVDHQQNLNTLLASEKSS